MRILVHCPLSPVYPRLYARTLASLCELDWPQPYELVCGVSRDAPDAEADVAGKLKRARRLALAGDYDALLVVGHDVQVPPDVLHRLAAADADRACGVTVDPEFPHAMRRQGHWDCVLLSRAGMEAPDEMTEVCVEDLTCARVDATDGGRLLWPDADDPTGVRIEYLNPQRAPATVPYSRTVLARKAA